MKINLQVINPAFNRKISSLQNLRTALSCTKYNTKIDIRCLKKTINIFQRKSKLNIILGGLFQTTAHRQINEFLKVTNKTLRILLRFLFSFCM